ncbi:MAG: DNA-binding NarL/FixJ family response regulator [Patiriisocius sp.]|jgi:DNA-binding NarL/FixJ family response regulator
MFEKVLIVDDHDVVNDGVSKILLDLGISKIHKSLYCDDANLKIKRAKLDNVPFDLVITDLSFKEDHRDCVLKSGEDLVKKLRSEQDNLAIIVFSQEDHFQTVRTMMLTCGANAFVWKSREGNKELVKAIENVYNDKQFLSQHVERALQQKEDTEITDYDIVLVKQLSLGLSQDEISDYLKKQGILPNSKSSVEKRLNKLKDQFTASNAIHLVTLMKDAKLI